MSIVNVKKQKNYYSFEWVVNKDVRLRFRYAEGVLGQVMAENHHYRNKFNPKRWVYAYKISDTLMEEIAAQCSNRFKSDTKWRTESNEWLNQQWEEYFQEIDKLPKATPEDYEREFGGKPIG